MLSQNYFFFKFWKKYLNDLNKRIYYDQVMDQIEPYLYEFTSQHRGSISAEHGLGFKKRNFIHFSKSDSAVRLMKQLKTVFDPQGIMNPYKVLPDQ